jgi:hypothetical protein
MTAGHPSGKNFPWVLDADGIGLQWGPEEAPFPKGEVVRMQDWGWKVKNTNVILKPVVNETERETNSDFLDDPTFSDVLYDRSQLQSGVDAKPSEEDDLVAVRVDGREFVMERSIVALHFNTVLHANAPEV